MTMGMNMYTKDKTVTSGVDQLKAQLFVAETVFDVLWTLTIACSDPDVESAALGKAEIIEAEIVRIQDEIAALRSKAANKLEQLKAELFVAETEADAMAGAMAAADTQSELDAAVVALAASEDRIKSVSAKIAALKMEKDDD